MNAVDLYTAIQIITQHVCQAQMRNGNYYDPPPPEIEVRPHGNTLQLTCLAPLTSAQMHQVHHDVLADERWVPFATLQLVLTGTLDPPAPHWPEGQAGALYGDYDASDDSLLIPLMTGGTPIRRVPGGSGVILNVQEDGTITSIELCGIGALIKDERRAYREARKKLVA